MSLEVQGVQEKRTVKIGNVLSCDGLFPSVDYSIPTIESVRQYPHLRGLKLPSIDSRDVDIVIGADVISKYPSMSYRKGEIDLSSAEYTVFGWALMGKDKTLTSQDGTTVNFISTHPRNIQTAESNFSRHCEI